MSYAPTNSDSQVGLSPDDLERRIATFCANQSIKTDAQWATAVGVLFNATNASGLSASTRTFLIEFFTKFVKVG